MIANTTGKVVDYILEEDREKPESEQTVFRLRGLSKRATAQIQDSLVGYDVSGSIIVSRPGTGALTAVKLGLDGWTNMRDEAGNEVRPHFITPKSKGGIRDKLRTLSPKSLDSLPQWAIDELGAEIMVLNGLTGNVEADDAETDEDPTETSATRTGSSSLPPSPPATPKTATASSPSSGRAQTAPA